MLPIAEMDLERPGIPFPPRAVPAASAHTELRTDTGTLFRGKTIVYAESAEPLLTLNPQLPLAKSGIHKAIDHHVARCFVTEHSPTPHIPVLMEIYR